MADRPFFSVIIATRNRATLLVRTLDALIAQAYPRDRFEIVVADNGSTDDTASTVRSIAARQEFPPVHYLFAAEPGKSYAVNAALGRARGDLLAFTDDDVRPDPNWLDRLADALTGTGADFAAGRIFPIWENPPPAWVSSELHGVLAIRDNGPHRSDIRSPHDDVMPIGANMAVTRRVIEQVGGLRQDLGKLDGTLRTGEDHEFFYRMLEAGFQGIYEPGAVVHHWVPKERLTASYFRRWLYQNGRDVAQLDATSPVPVRRALGVPRYLWKQGALDLRGAAAATERDPGARFAATTRLLWLVGYVRESWFRPRRPAGEAGATRRVSQTG